MQQTKIYENTTDQPVNVLGVGVIQPHDRISITAEFHTPVNLANYPGVIDLIAYEAQNGPAAAPQATAVEAVSQPGLTGALETQPTEGL